jgi:hypothetical protein
MGRLDPIRAVLSGKAHCSGYKYMRLLHFGQAFDLRSERWVEFYAAQEDVAKQRAKLLGGGGGSGGSGTGGGGQLLLGSGSSSDSSSRNHTSSSCIAFDDGDSSAALFDSSAVAPLAQLSFDAPLPALVGLVGLAHERFADVASRYTTALRQRPFDFFSYAAAAAAAASSPFVPLRSDSTPQPPQAAMVGLRQQCSAAVAQLLLARASSTVVSPFMPLHSQLQPPQPQHPSRQPQPQPQPQSASSVLRSMLQRARQVHASTRIVFACDDFD